MSAMQDSLRAQLMAEEIKGLRRREAIVLSIDPFAAFQLVAALQLVWRHPGLSDSMRLTIETFGRQMQAAFPEQDTPQIALTLEQGWDREYDR